MRLETEVEDNASIARRLLMAFRGYNVRQNFVQEDLQLIVGLLNQWDGQVEVLERAVSDLQTTMIRQAQQIEELSSENDSLREQAGLRGVLSYLKLKAGLS